MIKKFFKKFLNKPNELLVSPSVAPEDWDEFDRRREREDTIEKIIGIINNIRRFEAEEEEGDKFFQGWNSALDTVVMDIKREYENIFKDE